MTEQIKKEIVSVIESSHNAIVCSIDENGFPNAKTLTLRKNEGIQTLWFSSNLSAIHTQQWLKNTKACVYFTKPESIISIMLTGRINVHTDDETKQLHWKQGDEEFYALGPTDPDYCMLSFTADNGNYMAQKKYVFSIENNSDTLIYKYDNKWTTE